jgi:hypothetical protein
MLTSTDKQVAPVGERVRPDTQLERHPALVGLVPAASPEDRRRLKEDIRLNGQREEIETYEGYVVDGMERLGACQALGIDCMARERAGEGGVAELIAYAVSKNLARRHLSKTQRAALACKAARRLQADMQRRQQEGRSLGGRTAGRGRRLHSTEPAPAPSCRRRKPQSTDIVAQQFGVSGTAVRDVRFIEKRVPELVDMLASGSITKSRARQIADAPEADRPKLLLLAAAGKPKINAGVESSGSPDATDQVRLFVRKCQPLAQKLDRVIKTLLAEHAGRPVNPAHMTAGWEFLLGLLRSIGDAPARLQEAFPALSAVDGEKGSQ